MQAEKSSHAIKKIEKKLKRGRKLNLCE